MAGWKEEYIKTHYHKDGKCLNCGFDSDLCVCDLPVLEEQKARKLDKQTLEWVLKRIRSVEEVEYYDYCQSLETLKSDVELAIKKGVAWDEMG
jgi:hypothetical protein